jgi:hypothetical protein
MLHKVISEKSDEVQSELYVNLELYSTTMDPNNIGPATFSMDLQYTY